MKRSNDAGAAKSANGAITVIVRFPVASARYAAQACGWIVMAVVVTLPWTKQRWALPFLCVLATTPEVSERLGKRHKTIGMWAHQMISLVRRWLPDRSIKLMGDTAYSVLELGLHAQHQQ